MTPAARAPGFARATGPRAPPHAAPPRATTQQTAPRSLVTLLPRLPPTVSAALDAPLAALQAAALDAVSPIFRAMTDAMEARILGMHAAHAAAWGHGEQDAAAGMMDTSGYVAEVVASLGYFRWVLGAMRLRCALVWPGCVGRGGGEPGVFQVGCWAAPLRCACHWPGWVGR